MEFVALVRLPPSRHPRTRSFPELPSPPQPCSALAVRCRHIADVQAALAWRPRERSELPVALVLPRDAELLRGVVLSRARVEEICFVDELEADGGLPGEILARIQTRSRVGALTEELVASLAQPTPAGFRPLLRRIAEAGADGHGVGRLCRSLAMSESTLRRRLKQVGLPGPKRLLRHLRVRAVQRALDSGMDPSAAARASGWTDPAAFTVAARRARLASAGDWSAEWLARSARAGR